MNWIYLQHRQAHDCRPCFIRIRPFAFSRLPILCICITLQCSYQSVPDQEHIIHEGNSVQDSCSIEQRNPACKPPCVVHVRARRRRRCLNHELANEVMWVLGLATRHGQYTTQCRAHYGQLVVYIKFSHFFSRFESEHTAPRTVQRTPVYSC